MIAAILIIGFTSINLFVLGLIPGALGRIMRDLAEIFARLSAYLLILSAFAFVVWVLLH